MRCLLLACLAGRPAPQAQSYPTQTITITVTAAAGGVTDVVARAIGQRLAETWGQQVVIENKGGAAHSSARKPSPRRRPTAIRCWWPRPGPS